MQWFVSFPSQGNHQNNPLLAVYSRELKRCPHENLHTNVHISYIIYSSKTNGKRPKVHQLMK